jgi:Uncharacterized homolog of phage Mu protein gp47
VFEGMTYDAILADTLSRVTSDVDKREGSVVYDALAPACYKLAEYYTQLNGYIDLVMADTAVDDYLDRIVAAHGLSRKPATYAVRTVTTNEAVTIGSRWAIDDIVYDITAALSENTYSATCETPGTVGNAYAGALSNIDNTSDASATLGDIITSGDDIETDDALRTRFYEKVQTPATSGNADHYKQWALEVTGCGGAKVFPLWNGNGTVKILVVDENMAIDATLPASVAAYIETVRPIGAAVTVDSPTGLSISITANVKLDGSQTLDSVQTAFASALSDYLKSEVFVTYTVSYAKIGSLLLSVAGVTDYDSLLVNTATANITIPDTDIPMAGTVTLTEVI